jgi:hypothetical protein
MLLGIFYCGGIFGCYRWWSKQGGGGTQCGSTTTTKSCSWPWRTGIGGAGGVCAQATGVRQGVDNLLLLGVILVPRHLGGGAGSCQVLAGGTEVVLRAVSGLFW